MSGYDFDTIKAAFDIQAEVIRILGAPIESRHNYNVHPCPFHEERTPGAFKVYETHYFCFGCNKSGDVLDWFAWAQDRTLTEILKESQLDLTPEQIVQRKEEIAIIKYEAKVKADDEYADALEKLHNAKSWLRYHDNLDDHSRAIWRSRGVDDVWQDIWGLGYAKAFQYMSSIGKLTTPTITIPIRSIDGKVLNVRHRLLSAIDGDKYRPEISGLRATPFICDTDIEKGGDLIIVEGEIKAMVTFTTYDKPGVQCVGVPSKSMMDKTIRQSRGRNVIVIPDPDGVQSVVDAARYSGAKVLRLPKKIDDLILEHGLGKHWLRDTIQQARII